MPVWSQRSTPKPVQILPCSSSDGLVPFGPMTRQQHLALVRLSKATERLLAAHAEIVEASAAFTRALDQTRKANDVQALASKA